MNPFYIFFIVHIVCQITYTEVMSLTSALKVKTPFSFQYYKFSL